MDNDTKVTEPTSDGVGLGATHDTTKSVDTDLVSVAVEDTNSRIPRSADTREDNKRFEPWVPSRLLPTPDDRDGIDYRYVRVSSGGTVDNMNHSQALRDGWEPAKVTDFPELKMIMSDVGAETGNIVLGGMMLCVRPSHIGDRIKAHIVEESRAQSEGVDRGYLNDQNPAMQKFSEKSSRVTFGGNG